MAPLFVLASLTVLEDPFLFAQIFPHTTHYKIPEEITTIKTDHTRDVAVIFNISCQCPNCSCNRPQSGYH